VKQETARRILQLIEGKIREKLRDYAAESEYKPFFEAIFSKSVIVQASIMQSLYTTFGMSMYEQIADVLACDRTGCKVTRQYQLPGSIDSATLSLIEDICSKPIGTYTKEQEIEMIRRSIKASGAAVTHADCTVDVFVRDENSEVYIDITTAKPNKKEARALRRKLLIWAALRLSQDNKANPETYIGIPYNPYHPNQYSRRFVLDNCHRSEVLVQEELWSKFAGEDAFQELLDVFKVVGQEMRAEIEEFLRRDRST
jgi:hypothetical protein